MFKFGSAECMLWWSFYFIFKEYWSCINSESHYNSGWQIPSCSLPGSPASLGFYKPGVYFLIWTSFQISWKRIILIANPRNILSVLAFISCNMIVHWLPKILPWLWDKLPVFKLLALSPMALLFRETQLSLFSFLNNFWPFLALKSVDYANISKSIFLITSVKECFFPFSPFPPPQHRINYYVMDSKCFPQILINTWLLME